MGEEGKKCALSTFDNIEHAILNPHFYVRVRCAPAPAAPLCELSLRKPVQREARARGGLLPHSQAPTTERGKRAVLTLPKMDAQQHPWPARPSGVGVLPEYRSAAAAICVVPELMGSSALQKSLARLSSLSSSSSPSSPPESIDRTAARLVQAAFGLPTLAVAELYHGTAPGLDSGPAHFCAAVRSLYRDLGWERPYLHTALRALVGDYPGAVQAEDRTGLAVVCGLIARAASECQARKRFVFTAIINRLALSSPGGRGPPAEAAAASSSSSSSLPLPPSLHPSLSSSPAAAAAASRLYAACEAHVDALKEKAFVTTFLEPCTVFWRLSRNPTMEGDADVHGSNAILALLEASLGVRLSRIPLLEDSEIKGVADVLAEPAFRPLLDAYWADPNTVGLPVASVPAARRVAERLRLPPRDNGGGGGGYLFPARATVRVGPMRLARGVVGVRALGENAASPSPAFAAARARLGLYLTQYARAFEAPFLLRRLFSLLTSGAEDASAGGSGGGARTLADLQLVADTIGLTGAGGAGGGGDGDGEGSMGGGEEGVDVRHVLWDLSEIPPTFDCEAAQRLFAAIGVVKPEGWMLEPCGIDEGDGGAAAAAAAASSSSSSSSSPASIPPHELRLSAAACANGGGTGREFLANLPFTHEEGWSKWLHPGYVGRGSWVEAQLARPYSLSRYGIESANDCAHRDPAAWVLLGRPLRTDATGAPPPWVELDRVGRVSGGHFSGGRFSWVWRQIDPGVLRAHGPFFSAVRLQITEVEEPHDCLQIAHFHLVGEPMRVAAGGGEGGEGAGTAGAGAGTLAPPFPGFAPTPIPLQLRGILTYPDGVVEDTGSSWGAGAGEGGAGAPGVGGGGGGVFRPGRLGVHRGGPFLTQAQTAPVMTAAHSPPAQAPAPATFAAAAAAAGPRPPSPVPLFPPGATLSDPFAHILGDAIDRVAAIVNAWARIIEPPEATPVMARPHQQQPPPG